jgi:Flp pilus assembly protein TadG
MIAPARRSKQHGTTTVEFAIIGALLLTLIFAVIEFGRALFVFSALSEGTRRAARLASICPVNSAAIATAATFPGQPGFLPGFSTANVQLSYLDQNGAIVASPATNVPAIRYVRVSITNYQFALAIPFIAPTITAPAFPVTLLRESLGSNGAGGTLAC